jgi:dynein heavy chain 1
MVLGLFFFCCDISFWFCFPAVQSIKKQNLVEVKSMSNPPAPVKMALESICLLLGEATTDWKVIRSILTRENFISSIVNFSTDNIT